jgi:hypothetical protein
LEIAQKWRFVEPKANTDREVLPATESAWEVRFGAANDLSAVVSFAGQRIRHGRSDLKPHF